MTNDKHDMIHDAYTLIHDLGKEIGHEQTNKLQSDPGRPGGSGGGRPSQWKSDLKKWEVKKGGLYIAGPLYIYI